MYLSIIFSNFYILYAKYDYLPILGNLLIILDKVVISLNRFDKDLASSTLMEFCTVGCEVADL